MPRRKSETEELIHIRETFEAQLPIVAAILAMDQEDFNVEEIARQAIDLVVALEEELG